MPSEPTKELIPLDDSLCTSDQALEDYLRTRETNEQMVVSDWVLKIAPMGMVNVATFEEDDSLPARSTVKVKSFTDDATADDAARKYLADHGLVALTWGPAAIGNNKGLLIVAHQRPPAPADSSNTGTTGTTTTGGATGETTGKPISIGATTYSGPQSDFTTFLDIKPAQRPASLTAYWTNRGYNIAAQEAKLQARGIRTGTLNYSDAFMGAYDRLESDKTCASCRVPGGSVLALKTPDGNPYDPTGKNPTGEYRVTDTGNAKLTYAKPDIFTDTPNAYTSLDSVQVYLVSSGTRLGAQYKVAQSRYA